MVVIRNSKLILILVLILINLSCKESKIRYNNLPELYPNNKKELEAIVEYYKSIEENEKRVMFEFILDNITNYRNEKYSIINAENRTIFELDYPIRDNYLDSLISITGNHLKIDSINSMNLITARHLIEHVNSCYYLRKKFDWASKIDLTNFNNYIAPIQVYNEPFLNYIKFYQKRYLPYIEDVLVPNVPPEIVLKYYLVPFFESQKDYNYNIGFTSVLDFDKLKDGTKQDKDLKNLMVLQNYALRSLGIPNSIEYAPFIDNSNRGEMVLANFDPSLKTFIYNNYSEIYKFRIAKFYRNSFGAKPSQNPFFEISKLGIPYENIPFSLNIPNSIDVTNQRTKTKDVVLAINGENKFEKVLYLVAGFPGSNKVIAWAKVDRSKQNVRFKNIGTMLTYQLASFKKGKLQFLGKQFFLDSLGNVN